ncbi:hypothetical protein ACJ7VZ_05340 [Aeromonas salmonicida]|uniref:hypothetical protein n=1 Tax=Aeromonas salmonicida TaxID=645 RepID=UPI0038BA4BA0
MALADISVSNYTGIYYKDGTAFKEITDVEGISGITQEDSIVEVKQYNLKYARKLIGSGSAGPVELACTLNPSTDSYKKLVTLSASNARTDFKIVYFADAAKLTAMSRTFTGIVSSMVEGSEYDSQRTVTWTIAVDGALGALVDEVVPVK